MPSTEHDARIAEAVCDLAHRDGENFDSLELFYDLTTHALALLPVQCAGITVMDERSEVTHVTASDERCRKLEDVQIKLGEGPCVDSVRTDGPLVPALFGPGTSGNERWPRFAPHAQRAGITSIAAVPLRAFDTMLGALNLMNARTPAPTALDLRVAQAMASTAAAAFLHQDRIRSQQDIVAQLQGALNSRIVIEQAKGMLSERFRVSVDEAFVRLRGHARSRRISLSTLAGEIAQGEGPSELNPAPR
ncbi:GAF and ANTAR domain-containing protein [Amycolatopsis sp. CA-230715]|uniref:GAF and ANTAR domain-containing protein n=1 Tax=Amycolatopsis sp. CA-230715 TaxID=2745196 RepID=UPI001C01AA50|nr:GAF and ANTAR domain-containing protein [Amycolatopsis sp. CA-230715]QWF77851.1 hypothetical protein HUW46_01244 [Amycolatopsis sp. CA-230715]